MVADTIVVRLELDQMGIVPVPEARAMLSDLLGTRLPRLQRELQKFQAKVATVLDTEGPQSEPSRQAFIENAVFMGRHEYTKVTNPALVLIALPHDYERDVTSPAAKSALDEEVAQAAAVQMGMAHAKIVKLP
jgi:hypothetical protein